MNILVTGGSGLVGRYVVDELSSDHNVTVLDLKSPHRPELRFRRHDLLHHEGLVQMLGGTDAVVHLAGIPHPLNHPAETVFRVNVVGTYNLLEACSRAGVARFVFMSSESTLGFAFSSARLWPLSVPIDESHPLRPEDPYGLSKVTGELLCEGISRRSRLTTVCLRPPWIWVPEEKEVAVYRQLVDNYRNWWKNLWAFIHVRDVARAVRLALQTDIGERHVRVYICADRNWTGRDSRELLEEFYPEVGNIPSSFNGAQSLISHAAATRLLGFQPRYGVDDIFALR